LYDESVKDALFEGPKIVIHTDGGARGNPGPAAVGFVIGGKEYGEYLGVKTNNQAEYLAVIYALEKIKQRVGKAKAKQMEIEVRLDSELVARQLGGKYKISEQELQSLFMELWNLKLDFKSVTFVHVPRGENTVADRMVNEALDRETRGRS
jgi:ribonuclease HI/probable phosphoglycerate mutase